jgi:hypothetical protein
MLDELIKQDHVRAWHRGTLFAPYLDGYVGELAAQGFAPGGLREKLCAVTWFAEHLRRQSAQKIAAITGVHVEDFVAAQCRGRGPACVAQRRKAVKDLLQHLESRGAWTPPPPPEPPGPVQDFYRSLADERGLRAADLRLDGLHRQVLLRGKGKKERICPLWQNTVAVLRDHLAEIGIAPDSDERIFLNRRTEPLTRYGVNYILGAHAEKAAARIPSIADKRVSPHTIRHTTAVHLLNAGVDIDVIRAWLGHVDVRTTNIYTEINLATKRRALEMCAPRSTGSAKPPAWRKSPDILALLEAM